MDDVFVYAVSDRSKSSATQALLVASVDRWPQR